MAEERTGLAALLEGVRRREQGAARELVEHLYPLVVRIVRAHRARRLSEEDLCQEVFMSVFASLDQYAGRVPFEHWVSSVAVNTCIDQLRREKSRPELRWADLPGNQADALQRMLVDERRSDPERSLALGEIVEHLLGCLPPDDRLLIQWLEIEDRSVGEISRRTGWNVPRIKVRALRARRRMRRALNRLLQGEQP